MVQLLAETDTDGIKRDQAKSAIPFPAVGIAVVLSLLVLGSI